VRIEKGRNEDVNEHGCEDENVDGERERLRDGRGKEREELSE